MRTKMCARAGAILLLALWATPACGDSSEQPPAEEPAQELDPLADADGDGIPNGDEVMPVMISANTSGWRDLESTWTVDSDPMRADTDGDGLSDSEERLYGTNPRATDTDGDGLSDFDEVELWATSPIHVDTDGDSIPIDPRFDSAPNLAMFDGAELALREDLDGALTPGTFATSPRHADTDGDAVDDLTELLSGTRSPTVAEVARVSIAPQLGSSIEMAINTVDSLGESDTVKYSQNYEFTEQTNINQNGSAELSLYVDTELTVWEKISADVGCCTDFGGVDVEAGLRWESSFRMESTISFGFGTTFSQDLQNTHAQALSDVETEGVVMTGGRVALSLVVTNTGPVTYEIGDLALVMRYRSPASSTIDPAFFTLGELVRGDTLTRCPSTTTACSIASTSILAPGESIQLVFGNNDLPLEPMLDIVKNPDLLSVDIARFDLRDANGTDLDFVYRDLRSRTAIVNMNTDELRGQYHVAADVHTYADGTERGVRVADALTQIGLEYAREDREGDTVVMIDGVDGLRHLGPAPDLQADGADPLGYDYAGAPGERLLRRGWVAIISRADADREEEFNANFFGARLYPGDVLEIALAEDIDRDGIISLEERIRGSFDGKIHSDGSKENPLGDGLSDYFELREGWIVETVDRIPYRAFPRPDLVDSDGDGLTDAEESPFDGGPGTDPRLVDTDGDGYSDLLELTAGGGRFDPLEVEDRPPIISCSWLAGTGCTRVYTFDVADGYGDVDAIVFDPADGSDPFEVALDATFGTSYDARVPIEHCHQAPEVVDAATATITDSMQDSYETSCRRIR